MDKKAYLEALELLMNQCPEDLRVAVVVSDRAGYEHTFWSCCPVCALLLYRMGAELVQVELSDADLVMIRESYH